MPKPDPKVIIIPIIVIAAVVAAIWLAVYFSSGPAGAGNESLKPSYDDALAEPVTDQDHQRGASDPRVTVVVYSDFQCPACAQFELKTVDQLLAKFPDDLRFVFRHFPITGHPVAQKAAEATEAAQAQGKFWEMVQAIYENQNKLTASLLYELAGSLGLDAVQFKSDLDSGRYKDFVAGQKDGGQRSGVDATPTLYINGEKYEGRLNADAVAEVISKKLP